ncbi:TetR/AcrR family transcriptional regulator [Promicromonospora sp. NPDC057488]|uniref:TetR/AcrR family transcriptional regulator n=1 Tax=Promicromonospora sp. NPDC057488 TaxID=3346147 RepID=UPI00366C38E3
MSDTQDAGFQATGTVRPGGRTARTRSAVHDAVRELMAANGGESPDIPAVAAHAGVHPATIYRRWRTRDALALDVAVSDVNESSPIPATGDLRADLLAYTRDLIETFNSPGGLSFVQALATASRDTHLGPERTQELLRPRFELFQRMLDASGATELEPMDLVLLILAPAHLGTAFGMFGQGSDAEALVDNVLDVAAGRRARRSAR